MCAHAPPVSTASCRAASNAYPERRSRGLTALPQLSLAPRSAPSRAQFRDYQQNKVAREHQFPLDLVAAGLAVSLHGSHAASEQDKRNILQTLTMMSPLSKPVATVCEEADAVFENALSGRMAVAALRLAVDSDSVALVSQCLKCLKTSGLRVVHLNMSSCAGFTAKFANGLATHLPPTLEFFSLHFNDIDPMVRRSGLRTRRALPEHIIHPPPLFCIALHVPPLPPSHITRAPASVGCGRWPTTSSRPSQLACRRNSVA